MMSASSARRLALARPPRGPADLPLDLGRVCERRASGRRGGTRTGEGGRAVRIKPNDKYLMHRDLPRCTKPIRTPNVAFKRTCWSAYFSFGRQSLYGCSDRQNT